jgi:phthalate 4,5-dioxygenase
MTLKRTMLTKEDNDLITKCGPGTPMGNLMRQYWIPAMLSSELPTPDCAPIRVRLLNENLIAFRVTSGKVGLIEDYCPHRGASMFFARNAEDGLRCVYHGWKFDVTGRCTDIMTEPEGSTLKEKVRTTAYPTEERNGLVWVYMGPRTELPPLPELEANMVPQSKAKLFVSLGVYNWLQAMENNMDTAHNAVLHHGTVTPEDALVLGATYFEGPETLRMMVADRAPCFDIRETDYGAASAAHRTTADGQTYWRVMNWLWPFYTQSPTSEIGSTAVFFATVPVDDHHCMIFGLVARVGPGRSMYDSIMTDAYTGTGRPTLPNTSDWLGRFRDPLMLQFEKDFNIDRELQRLGTPTVQGMTGILDINAQDEAMRWSQGRAENNGIVDRSKEHLGHTDAMITRVRKKLLTAAKALRDHGTLPPAVDTPDVYRVRSGWTTLGKGADWWESMRNEREGFKLEIAPAMPANGPSRSAALALIGGGMLALARPASAQAPGAIVRVGAIPIDADGESYYGVSAGIYASNGINAVITTLNTGSAIVAAVLAGDLDVGLANPLQIAVAISRNIPFQTIAPAVLYALRDSNPNLVVAKASPFKSPKDLIGATFGVPSLSDFNQLSLLAYLDANKIPRDSVHFVELPFTEIGAALQRGIIQSGILTEPFKTIAMEAGQIRDFGDTYLSIRPEIVPAFWFATKGWIQKNPEVAKNFVNAIFATAKWANAHTKESGDVLAKVAKMDPAVVAKMTRIRFATSNDRKYSEHTLALAYQYGMLARPVTFEEFNAF